MQGKAECSPHNGKEASEFFIELAGGKEVEVPENNKSLSPSHHPYYFLADELQGTYFNAADLLALARHKVPTERRTENSPGALEHQ